MRLTNYLLLTILVIAFAIYGFKEIGKSITDRTGRTADQIRKIQ